MSSVSTELAINMHRMSCFSHRLSDTLNDPAGLSLTMLTLPGRDFDAASYAQRGEISILGISPEQALELRVFAMQFSNQNDRRDALRRLSATTEILSVLLALPPAIAQPVASQLVTISEQDPPTVINACMYLTSQKESPNGSLPTMRELERFAWAFTRHHGPDDFRKNDFHKMKGDFVNDSITEEQFSGRWGEMFEVVLTPALVSTARTYAQPWRSSATSLKESFERLRKVALKVDKH